VVSALVLLRRTGPSPPRAVIDLIHAAFAHRRKALAGSLALTPGGSAELRDRTRTALAEIGHPPDVRAERLVPGDFARLADLISWGR
jgi:16S rRNA (adenine1518-N6/adenine1519-N6)-dimethyltransferase